MTLIGSIEAAEESLAVHEDLKSQLRLARARRELRDDVIVEYRRATMTFIETARGYGLHWASIGAALGVTDTAARRFYQRYREDL